MEEEILIFWKENNVFKKSIEQRDIKKSYVFYDGPPFATGTPHYGHIVGSVMKDIIPRYWTMKGYRVERKWGWDCHGLPIENIAEKELGFKTKKEIKELGVEKFNEICHSKVLSYVKEWEKVIERLGRWADMDNAYKTMDLDFMESVWWVFKQLWDKGLIYEGYRSMAICPRCETTLSQQEIAEGYKIIKDLSATVKFELEDEPKTFVLAWTTTPWTLIGNVALAIGENIDYVKISLKLKACEELAESIKIQKLGEYFILAKDRLIENFKNQEYEIISEFKGSELIGKKYKPVFDYYFKNENLENKKNGWKIYSGDFVTIEEGTGVVHIAPAFGEDDMNLGKENSLPFIQHVNMDGTIKIEAKNFAGMNVKPIGDTQKTDIEIIKYLAHNESLFKKEKYEHSYPHCWRCETPLINYATTSWFVAVTKVKEKAIKFAQEINWSPSHIKEGRFGNWLSGSRDWSISRQRFWASVIPIWKCSCGEMKVFGSVKELEDLIGHKITDLHKHTVDKITFKCEKCEKEMKRIPDVLDTWFDSGSMPYAQMHYPFENKEKFEANFPAEFIAEGIDQTRAWFYYLHIIGTAINNSNAFKNVIVNGIVLAEDGKKMAKRLNNYSDPKEIFDKYGADAMRFYLASSPVMKAENLSFSEKGVDEANKKILNTLWNVYKFYELHSNNLEIKSYNIKTTNVLDQWILAKLNLLIKEITVNMDAYKIINSCQFFETFISELSTWYIRRSRERFKLIDENNFKPLIVLHYILLTLSKLMAPFTPFIAEKIYQNLKTYNLQPTAYNLSIHLCDWPQLDEEKIDQELIKQMDLVRQICELGHSLRSEAGIKVRQTLGKFSIFICQLADQFLINEDCLNLIKEELNVKNIEIVGELPKGENWKTREENKIQMALNIEITPELKQEGIFREIIRQINVLRKEKGLTIKDKIDLYVYLEIGETKEVFEKFKEKIEIATLCNQLLFIEHKKEGVDFEKEIKIENQVVWTGIKKY